jgi:hypothetical protein
MEFMDALKLLIGSGGVIGVFLLLFKLGGYFKSIDERFDMVNKRFDSIDKRFDSVERKIDSLQADVRNIDRRLSHVEGYLAGRSYRNGTDT